MRHNSDLWLSNSRSMAGSVNANPSILEIGFTRIIARTPRDESTLNSRVLDSWRFVTIRQVSRFLSVDSHDANLWCAASGLEQRLKINAPFMPI